MNAQPFAIQIEDSPQFRQNQNHKLLLEAFPIGDEFCPIPISENGEWSKPGFVFNPYSAFRRYFRLRESVEKDTCIGPGAKLAFAILEYWLRYQINHSQISASLLGSRIGVNRPQAHQYIKELEEHSFIRIRRDHRFTITDSKAKNRDPKTWREYGSIIPAAVASMQNIEMLDKLVYGHLVRSAGSIGKTWKSQQKIATALGLSKRRILHSVERLEKEFLILTLHPHERPGWIGVNRQNRKAGARGAQNIYTFLGHKALLNQSREEK